MDRPRGPYPDFVGRVVSAVIVIVLDAGAGPDTATTGRLEDVESRARQTTGSSPFADDFRPSIWRGRADGALSSGQRRSPVLAR